MSQNDDGDVRLITPAPFCGDADLAELYHAHAGAVYDTARRVLRSATEAEDVTQEVFMRLWKQPDRFDPTRGTLRAFLVAQAHSRAVDVVRTHNARRRREMCDLPALRAADKDMLHDVWQIVRADHLSRALDGLPIEERRAIELAYFDERTYHQVAELLQQPEGTIKSRIRNGMRRMRAALAEAGIQGVEP